MKQRRAVYGWMTAVLLACVALWLGGRWLPMRGIGFALHARSEYEARDTVVGGVEVRAQGFNASSESHTTRVPFVMRVKDGNTYAIKVEIGVPEEIDGAVRILSAKATLGDRTEPLTFTPSELDAPPEPDWHPLLESYRGTGRLAQMFADERLEIPAETPELVLAIAFEIRTADGTRRREATLKLPRREWSSNGPVFNWRPIFGQ
ncbi:MAG: hypothetical protein ACYTGV_08110 [Planctomycetota bacterium]|jgi:hypothetical protein